MALPTTPANFSVNQGNGQVYVTWSLTPNIVSYQLQKSVDGINFINISTASTNSYLDTLVSVGSQYYYQVCSLNATGTSSFTKAQSVVPCMQGQMSLSEIRTRSKQRADMVNSGFVTDSEWNYYINQSYTELYDLLITTYEDYYVAPRLMFTTTGSSSYVLPNGQNYSGAPAFYKMFGMDLGLDGSNNAFVSLKKFDFISRNKYVYPQITSTLLGVFNMQYRVVGGNIQFIPVPTSGQNVGVWYFPRLNTLLQDTDICDGISGWTEYVIVDAAIKALNKEESDSTALMNEKLMLQKRIEGSATNRDAGQPDTVSDTRSWSERWGGFGNAGGGPTAGY